MRKRPSHPTTTHSTISGEGQQPPKTKRNRTTHRDAPIEADVKGRSSTSDVALQLRQRSSTVGFVFAILNIKFFPVRKEDVAEVCVTIILRCKLAQGCWDRPRSMGGFERGRRERCNSSKVNKDESQLFIGRSDFSEATGELSTDLEIKCGCARYCDVKKHLKPNAAPNRMQAM